MQYESLPTTGKSENNNKTIKEKGCHIYEVTAFINRILNQIRP